MALFNLIYTDEIMDKLVEWTNAYADEQRSLEDEDELPTHRGWLPTSRKELYAYFSVLIHIGIAIKSAIEDY